MLEYIFSNDIYNIYLAPCFKYTGHPNSQWKGFHVPQVLERIEKEQLLNHIALRIFSTMNMPTVKRRTWIFSK